MNSPLALIPFGSCRRAGRRGVTLAELIVSLFVMSILAGGMVSAVLIATNAVPDTDDPTQAVLDARAVVDQIAGDLLTAQVFTERIATALEFTIPDRNADLAPETVRYAWSGTPGDPLTWQYNGGTVVNLVQDVREFDLSYSTRTVTTTETQGGTTTSAEFMMASFEGWDGIPPSPLPFPVTLTGWAAEFFTVSGVPPEADSLSITRVELQMCQGTLLDAGTFSVGIHDVAAPGNPEPATDPIGTPVVVSSSTLNPYPTFDWEGFTFSDVLISNPSTEYVIVLKGSWPDISPMDAQVRRYTDRNAPADDTVALWTSDSGSSWDPRANRRDEYDTLFRVYGRYETTGEQLVDVTRYFVTRVNVQLRVGPDASTRVETAVQVLNAPEVTGP